MMKPERVRLLGAGAAVAISAAALMLPTLLAADRQPGDPALSPFGYYRVVVMHAMATLLLSWVVAGLFVPDERSARWWAFWTVAGIGIAALTIALGGNVGSQLNATQVRYSPGAIYAVRLIVRILWCLLLQLPWCVLSRTIAEPQPEPRTTRSTVHIVLLALVTAILVPVGYLNVLVHQQSRIASELWGRDSLTKARQIVLRLRDVGSFTSLGQQITLHGKVRPVLPRLGLAQLDERIAVAREEIEYLRSVELTDEMCYALATHLTSLGELVEAESVIEPLAQDDPLAAILLAQVHQKAGQWRASNKWFRRTVELVRAAKAAGEMPPDPANRMQRGAYDALASNYRELKQYDRAEKLYFEAIERLPSEEAHFHYSLSKHYELSGRAKLAEKHLQKAYDLAPEEDRKPVGTVFRILATGSPVGIFAPAGKEEADDEQTDGESVQPD